MTGTPLSQACPHQGSADSHSSEISPLLGTAKTSILKLPGHPGGSQAHSDTAIPGAAQHAGAADPWGGGEWRGPQRAPHTAQPCPGGAWTRTHCSGSMAGRRLDQQDLHPHSPHPLTPPPAAGAETPQKARLSLRPQAAPHRPTSPLPATPPSGPHVPCCDPHIHPEEPGQTFCFLFLPV